VDPYSNRHLDPDPYSVYGSGSSRSNLAIKLKFEQISHNFHLFKIITYTMKNYLFNKIPTGTFLVKKIISKIFVKAFEKTCFFKLNSEPDPY